MCTYIYTIQQKIQAVNIVHKIDFVNRSCVKTKMNNDTGM